MATNIMSTEMGNQFDNAILSIINKIKMNHKRPDTATILNELIKMFDFHIDSNYLQDHLHSLVEKNLLICKINMNKESYSVNESIIETEIQPSCHSSVIDIINLSTLSETTYETIIPTKNQIDSNVTSLNNSAINKSENCIDDMFDKIQYDNLKEKLLDDITRDIRNVIADEIRSASVQYKSTSEPITSIDGKLIDSLKDELKPKDTIIKNLTNIIHNLTSRKEDDIEIKSAPNFNITATIAPEDSACNINPLDDLENLSNKRPSTEVVESSNQFVSLANQLEIVKSKKRQEYLTFKSNENTSTNVNEVSSDPTNSFHWPNGTTLILGDSIINGISEEKLSKDGKLVKVRHISGALVKDMMHHVIPFTEKKPSNIIVHVGTNCAPNLKSRDILNELLLLKSKVKEKLPTCKFTLSTPTLRSDNGKAALTVSQLSKHLLELDIDVVDNNNIKSKHLSRKGLHLNGIGNRRLAKNFLEYIRKN